MRVLVFGRDGQVGHALGERLAARGPVSVGRERADLSQPGAAARVIGAERPDVIVNAAAYTAVDRAESEPALAARVNAAAPGEMAQAAARAGALLVHYSTDYVFDGSSRRPWRETDPVAPLGVYGRTKLEGERAVAAATDRYLCLRTSWVYSRHGHNFLNTMLRLVGERDELRVVADQVGAPTWAGAIAEGTARLLDLVEAQGGLLDGQAGTFHMCCAGQTSWHGFATRILARTGSRVPVVPIPTAGFPTPAARPAYSVLDCTRLRETFGITLPAWEQALDDCLAGAGEQRGG